VNFNDILTPLKRHISVLLLLAFFIIAGPKELIHEFFHHDTTDTPLNDITGTRIEKGHEHCDLFQLTSPPFRESITTVVFRNYSGSWIYTFLPEVFPYKNISETQYLRGPPLS
jgi:hypothetical protein